MIRKICALLLILPGFLHAQEVPILSGEHDSFTRLVLQISPTISRQTGEEESVYWIEFEGDFDMQISGVFDRIPRSRLANIRSQVVDGKTRLELTLDCECLVEVSPYQGAYIIVDLNDPTDMVKPIQEEIELSSVVIPTFVPSQLVAPELESGWEVPVTIEAVGPDDMPMESHAETQDAPIDETLEETITEARNALVQQLGLAADMGLLDYDPELVQPEHEDEADTHLEIAHEPVAEAQPLDIFSDEQVDISSVFAGREPDNLASLLGPEPRCFPEFVFDLDTWGGEGSYIEELAQYRSGIYGEFDTLDTKSINGMVRLNIRYGFGAEARDILRTYPDIVKDQTLLEELSVIMDGGHSLADSNLARARTCDGDAGMWALVADPKSTDPNIGDIASVVEAFTKLSPEIREMIGKRLIDALVAIDLDDEAGLVLGIMRRSPDIEDENLVLVDARQHYNDGDVTDAEDLLLPLSKNDSPVATDALIDLLEIYRVEGKTLTPQLSQELAAEVVQRRGTEQGDKLFSYHTLFLTRSGHGLEAIEAANVTLPSMRVAEDFAHFVYEGIYRELKQSDDDFVRVVLDYLYTNPRTPLEDEELVRLSAGLTFHGFPDISLEVLNLIKDPTVPDVLIRKAQAQFAMGHTNEAIHLVAGLIEVDAKLLRIKAALHTRDFETALAQLSALNADDLPSDWIQWLDGSWTEAAIEDPFAEEIFRKYVQMTGLAGDSVATDSLDSEDAPLAHARALVETTTDLKAEVSTFFD